MLGVGRVFYRNVRFGVDRKAKDCGVMLRCISIYACVHLAWLKGFGS